MLMTAAGLALVAFGLGLFVPSMLAHRTRRRTAADHASLAFDLAVARADRDHYRRNYVRYLALYLNEVRANAVLLEHVGDERSVAEQAAVETPLYFDTAALGALRWLDEGTDWGQP